MIEGTLNSANEHELSNAVVSEFPTKGVRETRSTIR